MKRESVISNISSIFFAGLLILTAWGNAWAMVIFSVAGLSALLWFMPAEKRKATWKLALTSGGIAFLVALFLAYHAKIH